LAILAPKYCETLSGGSDVKHQSFRISLAILLTCGVMAICSVLATAQDAAATYKAKCAMCHGPDGKGGKVGTKDFASPEVQSQSDAQFTEAINKGKPPKMPAYEGKLKDTEIKDLVAYVRGLGKK
jgi:cytochrome c6